MKYLLIALLSYGLFIHNGYSSHVGVVVKKQGEAELLTSPSKTVKGSGKKVLYQNTYYSLKKVRPGTKIQNGNILRTKAKSKLKIIFKNGDQFNVGEATAYKISWNPKKTKENSGSTVNIIYGSLRGIISKKGPRNNLKVESKNAVMGVRGTDFHFFQRGTSGKAEISVLRGKVEVSNTKGTKKTKQVPQGFSAEVSSQISMNNALDKKEELSLVQVNKITKDLVVEIQKDSQIEKPEKIPSQMSHEIKKLEATAVKTTLEDIKEYQPEVYAEIEKKKVESIDEVNTQVMAKTFKKAPAKKVKKGLDELDMDLEEDAYDKYFKIESE